MSVTTSIAAQPKCDPRATFRAPRRSARHFHRADLARHENADAAREAT
jgi:hypothetical protein